MRTVQNNQLPNPAPAPSGDGCKECLENGTWWLHLRRCLTCGHIGCCDSSPNQHARKHWHESGHQYLTTFEPESPWIYDYTQEDYSTKPLPKLTPPLHRPLNQPAPGPEGKVPEDWRAKLN